MSTRSFIPGCESRDAQKQSQICCKVTNGSNIYLNSKISPIDFAEMFVTGFAAS